MSLDGGGERKKKQEDEEKMIGAVSSDNNKNQREKSDEIERKRKLQNKVRCQRYRDKKKSEMTINSRISQHQTITVEEEIIIKRRKEQDKQKSKRYRDKKRAAYLNNLQTDQPSKTIAKHVPDLTLELKRLQNNTLQTATKTFLEFISNKKGLSIFLFNSQSLHAHAADLKNDAIVKKSNVLLLSETRIKNEEPLDIPNFNFVVSYKRPEVPAGGVATYHNTQDTSHFITSYMDIHTKFTRSIGVNVSDIGEICVACCSSENGQYILMVAVYISPGKSMRQIQQFLFENLIIYTKEGSKILEKRFGEKYDNVPMILSGDFNINFADDKNLPLIEFLNETLNLNMSNDRKLSTEKYKTTIDAVFTRYLDKFQSNIFISYFSYHKPIVSFLEHNEIIENTKV